jgi:transposase
MDIQEEIAQLRQALAEAQEALLAANLKIKELTERLNQNSRNSNWPSSRDNTRKKKRTTKSLRVKSNKKQGGQEGHQGHTLAFSDTPDVIEAHRPSSCQHCQAAFTDNQQPITIKKRQVHDFPPMRLIVHEHQSECLLCSECGQETQGEFPKQVTNPVQYGLRVQQLAVYLKTEQFIPYNCSRRFFADLFGINISPGTLQNIIKRAASRLRPVSNRIKEALITADVVHFDETGFYIGGERYWLHTAGTTSLTSYYPHKRRGRIATDEMNILPHFQGTAIHDHWQTYYLYKQCTHGACNVHHLRELTAVVENNEQSWAERFKWLLLSSKRVVEDAYLSGESTVPSAKIAQVERIYTKLIQVALRANPPPLEGWPKSRNGRLKKTKVRNLVERLDKRRREVLAYLYDFNVPFDNNLAERDIRMMKVQQKISGCFRSQSGAEDFCTIRGYISTMRKQGIPIWSALGSVFSDDILMPSLTPV